MGKSTLILIALAALGLGTLVGVSLVDDPAETEGAASPELAVAASSGGAPVFRFLTPDGITLARDEFGQPLPFGNGENFIAREGEFKTKRIAVSLDSDTSVEYKALMRQGDAIAFRWSVDGGQVYYDFHGHDDAFGPDFFTRYDEGEGTERSGTVMAAYSGQHGWYWLNIEVEPVTITLDVAGFYDELVEIDPGTD